MKKRNLILSIIFALLICLSFSPKTQLQAAYAESIYEITFDAGEGTCSQTSQNTNASGTLDTLPSATKPNFYFVGWTLDGNLISTSTVFSQNKTLIASYEQKANYYTISYESNLYKIVGKTTNNEVTYVLADNLTTLSSVISQIETDMIAGTAVTINFDNITLTENVNLTFYNLTITGNISLASYSIKFSGKTTNSNLTLDNLTLSSTSSQDQIEILGTNTSKIYVSNCRFNSTSNQGNYAIKINNKLSFFFSNTLVHSTAYLFNYIDNMYSSFNNNVDFSEQENEKVSITIPYYADSYDIITESLDVSLNHYTFCPTENFYTCYVANKNGSSIIASTKINLIFETNGGILNQNYTTTNAFYTNSSTNPVLFPTSSNLTKTHQTLTGFIGKITFDSSVVSTYSLSSATWYYDKTALNSFISHESNLEYVSTCFYSTIPTTTIDPFTCYFYDYQNTDLNFKAAALNLSYNQAPTFVAVWRDTKYKIQFNENGGNDVSDIEKLFGEEVTLPTPTKTGYDFVCWCSDTELNNSKSYLTMPDTNPTLYAKWSVHKHNLSIYQNNGTTKIDKQNIDYGTAFSTIAELDSTTLTKTGYTFDGWFIDSAFNNELTDTTMPDSNLSVYAKWKINKYTISLYKNHKTDDNLFTSLTQDYGSNISSLTSSQPSFEGYQFHGWFTDKFGQFQYTITDSSTMPSQNLSLYAFWIPIDYKLTFYYNTHALSEVNDMHLGDQIQVPNAPTVSGYKFVNWYLDTDFIQIFNLQTMPNHNVSVYAKMKEKDTISINEETQVYALSKNAKFSTGLNLQNVVVEYLIDGKWSLTTPTAIGYYDVKISRNEDDTYKAYNKVIENGIRITADPIDLSVATIIMFCVAGFEIVVSIIIIFLRKQKQSYLNYTIFLPFGVISNSQFIKFSIALALCIFGFVMLIIQIVKMHKVGNNLANPGDEKEKDNTPPDISQNSSISINVDHYLKEKGFIYDKEKTDN